MRITQITMGLIAVVVMGLFSCSSSTDEKETILSEASSQPPKEAAALPTFNMTDANGNIVNLSSFKGKKVFVNLWATWCPPCRVEIPSIEELAGKMDKQAVIFVMLSLDENFDIARQFAAAKKMKLPIYYPAEKLPALFNTEGIPATFIFDEQGHLVKQVNGADDYSTAQYINLLTK